MPGRTYHYASRSMPSSRAEQVVAAGAEDAMLDEMTTGIGVLVDIRI